MINGSHQQQQKVRKLGHCPNRRVGFDRRGRVSQPTYLVIFLFRLKLHFHEDITDLKKNISDFS